MGFQTNARLSAWPKVAAGAICVLFASCEKPGTANPKVKSTVIGESSIPSIDSLPILKFAPSDGPAVFSAEVGRAVRMAHGFVVADWGSGLISTFDTLGNVTGLLGRRGSGPGEFQSPNIVQVIEPNTLLVWDGALRRLSWVNVESGKTRSVQITPRTANGGNPVLGQINGHVLIKNTRVISTGGGGPDRQETEIRVMNDDGTQGAHVVTIPFGDFPTHGLQLYPPRLYVQLSQTAIHWAYSDRWRIERIAIDGTPLGSFERNDWRATAVTDEDKRVVRAEFLRRHIDMSLTTDEHFAEVRPAFGPLISNSDASLWLSGTSSPYLTADSLYFVNSTSRATIALRMPSRFRPTQIDHDRIIGIGFDDDDGAEVRVYRLHWTKQ